MAQRVLVKLDVLKRYEKKKLSKYDMVECQNLGKVQLKPYHRTPLTFDFKLFYEPTTKKSSIPAIPSLHNSYIIEKEQNSTMPSESWDIPSTSSSALSTHFSRNIYSGKSAVRPSSAPSYLKSNLKTADGSFLILKQKLKQKNAYSTSEVQKIPETLSDLNLLPARTCIKWDGETSVRETKDDIINQSEARREPTQDLRMENKFIVGTSEHLRSIGQDERKVNLPKDYLINDGQNIEAGFIYDNKSGFKKKEMPLLPLSIMDELENSNGKTISVRCTQAESQNQMKMSESFPIVCHERSRGNFAWNQWLLLYGKKTLDYLNQDNEACMDLNPVLQNNYDESIAIIKSKTYPHSSLTAKRKKKPTITRKSKPITIQILSLERQLSKLSVNSQKGTSLVQKTHGHFTKRITRHVVTEKTILQNMSQRNKDILMADGKKPTGFVEPSLSTVSRIKSSLAEFLKKPLTKSKERFKKSKAIVDYIPFPKPIPVCEAPEGLVGCKVPLLMDCTLRKPSDKLSADRSSSDQDPFLNETTADMELRAQDLESSLRKSGETSSETTNSSFLLDLNNESLESEKSAIYSKDKSSGDPSTVISIPTASPVTSESPSLSRPGTSSSGKTT
ncbi:uncharacterized protein C1orf141 homolog [Ahaetulla prasina]|uniref:uncharacterized protein C1orf141 homolog n=1 Tax=Ahaetulla prasina TaxID=499056 RepID=UPI0026488A0F|nr:uncharacterized protein C1orf141 homolog [Ahaetulla prasina]